MTALITSDQSTKKDRTLQQRVQDKIALWELIEESQGEVTPVLQQFLDEIEKSLSTKLDSYHFFMEELENEASRLRAEAKKFTESARSLENIQERMKERIKFVMQSLGTSEVTGNLYRFKLQNGPAKLILNESEVSNDFKVPVTTFEIDKTRIKSLIELGETVSGAELQKSLVLRTYVNKGGK